MLVVGLTGSMGCGKSTVAAMLASLGAGVSDADQLAREAVAPGSDGLGEVVARFGGEVLTPEGALDRRCLAERVFGRGDGRRELEAIIHPRVRRLQAGVLARWAEAGVQVGVLEVPLLFETGMDRLCDFCLVVVCGEHQGERLSGRGGVSEGIRRGVVACQMTEEEKVTRADGVIDNGGEVEETRRQVGEVWARLTGMQGKAWPTAWQGFDE